MFGTTRDLLYGLLQICMVTENNVRSLATSWASWAILHPQKTMLTLLLGEKNTPACEV